MTYVRFKRFFTLALPVLCVAAGAQAGPVTRVQDLGAQASQGTLFYGNAFNDENPGLAGVQITSGGVPLTLTPGTEFHDNYSFSTGAAQVSFITLTIDLGNFFNIDGLRFSLYDATGLVPAGIGLESQLDALPALASSAALAGSVQGEQQAINSLTLAAGSYVLDVRGFVTGTSGGSYSGVVNFSAVPEPAGSALVLLALLIGIAARRNSGDLGPNGP